MAGFLGGILGLQLVSELLHRCLPSSIVECESHSHSSKRDDRHIHHHDVEEGHDDHDHDHDDHDEERGLLNGHGHGDGRRNGQRQVRIDTEETPLLSRNNTLSRRPSLTNLITRSMSNLVKKCDNGRCYGYTDNRPCGVQCRNHIVEDEANKVVDDVINSGILCEDEACTQVASSTSTRASSIHSHAEHAGHHTKKTVGHHHVAKNEYLSIGLQTSIAVALHKVPEVSSPLPLWL